MSPVWSHSESRSGAEHSKKLTIYRNIENIDIEKVAILNTNEAENKSWTFQNTVTQNDETTDTREITHMFGVAITVSAEFKVGVPLFGSADITTGLETSYGYQNMKSVGTTEVCFVACSIVCPWHRYICLSSSNQRTLSLISS